jgi:hypothetical protein
MVTIGIDNEQQRAKNLSVSEPRMKLTFMTYIVIGMSLITTCKTSDSDASLENAQKPAARGYRIDMLVNGDRNCDPRPEPAPEPFVLDLSTEHSVINFYPSFITNKLSDIYEIGLEISKSQKVVIDDIVKNPDKAKAAKVEVIIGEIFTNAKIPVKSTRARLQVLPLLGQMSLTVTHEIEVANLLGYFKWIKDVQKKTSKDVRDKFRGVEDMVVFGTVRRSGTAPNFNVSFDPTDTILTLSGQNEAHDTTLCQLRTGIIQKITITHDIPVHSIFKITPRK